MADTDPYAQGRDARRRGCAQPDNPHAPGTPYARWDAGWHDEDALLQKELLRLRDIQRAALTEEARKLGRAACAAGAARSANPYVLSEKRRAWDEGWSSSMTPTAEAALLRPGGGPGPGCVVERPRPKIVQIVALAEGEQVLPALFALRDDGTLWACSLLRKDGGVGKEWVRWTLPPDEGTSDGR